MALRSTLTAEYSTYRPVGSRLLIRKAADAKEAGGILLPDKVTRVGLIEADVLQVGPKVEHIAAGARVYLHRQLSYNKIILDGDECEIVPQEAVVALIER